MSSSHQAYFEGSSSANPWTSRLSNEESTAYILISIPKIRYAVMGLLDLPGPKLPSPSPCADRDEDSDATISDAAISKAAISDATIPDSIISSYSDDEEVSLNYTCNGIQQRYEHVSPRLSPRLSSSLPLHHHMDSDRHGRGEGYTNMLPDEISRFSCAAPSHVENPVDASLVPANQVSMTIGSQSTRSARLHNRHQQQQEQQQQQQQQQQRRAPVKGKPRSGMPKASAGDGPPAHVPPAISEPPLPNSFSSPPSVPHSHGKGKAGSKHKYKTTAAAAAAPEPETMDSQQPSQQPSTPGPATKAPRLRLSPPHSPPHPPPPPASPTQLAPTETLASLSNRAATQINGLPKPPDANSSPLEVMSPTTATQISGNSNSNSDSKGKGKGKGKGKSKSKSKAKAKASKSEQPTPSSEPVMAEVTAPKAKRRPRAKAKAISPPPRSSSAPAPALITNGLVHRDDHQHHYHQQHQEEELPTPTTSAPSSASTIHGGALPLLTPSSSKSPVGSVPAPAALPDSMPASLIVAPRAIHGDVGDVANIVKGEARTRGQKRKREGEGKE